MGRSKFPGKPPKTVTRKRIKVLGQPEAISSDSVTVAENIFYGLSLFNETFGDSEKEHPPFHGFSSKEANLSASYVKTQQHDAQTISNKKSSCTTNKPQDNVTSEDNKTVSTEDRKEIETAGCNSLNDNKNKHLKVIGSERVVKLHKSKNYKHCKNIKFTSYLKTPVLKSVNNILDQHQRTRQLRNSTAKRLLQRAKSNNHNARNIASQSSDKSSNVRKFVLPVRSAHSSRVIKPNKRFIEELEEPTGTEQNEHGMCVNIKKTKIALSKLSSLNSKVEESNGMPCIRKNCKDLRTKRQKMISCTSSNLQARNRSLRNKRSIGSVQRVEMKKEIFNDLESCSESSLENPTLNIPKIDKVLPASHISSFKSSRIQTRSETQNETSISNSVIANKTVEASLDNLDTESVLSESESEHSNNTEDEQSEWTGMKLNGGKVILRKARLKLDNKCIGGPEGPFSTTNTNASNGNSNLGLTGTIKCGVCGAVRFYRFIKQARKFGIHSCESCRKFISKMIKRQACAKSTNNALPVLQCHKGDGMCLVPPVVRSQQWNLMRCVYKARCPACWLKMCLKCYNIPITLRTGLNALLPTTMRDTSPSVTPVIEDTDNQNQKLTLDKLGWPVEGGLEKNLFKSAMSWRNSEIGPKTNHQNTFASFLYTRIDKFDSPFGISPTKKRRKENRIKVRKKIKPSLASFPATNQCPQPLRQRFQLKGPRVKHVCRSASVALGQPIATFPLSEETGENTKITPKLKEKECKKDDVDKHNEENSNLNVGTIQQSNSKKSKPPALNISTSNPSSMNKRNSTVSNHAISIDFWEQYDPMEIGARGFALIGSEVFHIPAICYLCGSAGQESLIYCQCCCEPYHAFCLEPSEWNACLQPNWSCPRCTICQSCQQRSGPKLSCIRCRQSFHHSCLSKSGVSSRLYSPDRPYVCHSCIKCKSCGSQGVSFYVGNLPLCSMCFKLRQQGNYCPLCQKCYNENDFDTKMMECSECSCWIHSRCEGLSDERYQILSYLPDSIEFACRQCCPDPNSTWRNAIESELRAGYNRVIKSLSKNRTACAALKWSPQKECLCKPRRLDFISDKFDDNVGEKLSETEIDEKTLDGVANRRTLRRARQKLHFKDCSIRTKNSISKENQETDRNLTTNESSSLESTNDPKDCQCSDQQIITRPSPTLMTVKRKVSGNEYESLQQFHGDMECIINRTIDKELVDVYHKVLRQVFPWLKLSKINFDDVSESHPYADSCNNSPNSTPVKSDNVIMDKWKEDISKTGKSLGNTSITLYDVNVEDDRLCCLCKGLGDRQENKEGRLLYCGQNEWIHSNCALWSNEVFEEIDGSLQNVHNAISRGRLIRCHNCAKKGASVGCCAKNCHNTFHYPCAREIGLCFNNDKTVYCGSHLTNNTSENEIDFNLERSVYVELERKKKKLVEPSKVKVMIGSLMIDCLGSIVPEISDTIDKIIPCDYRCSKLYWSTINPSKIVKYYIRTYIQVYVPETSYDLENNITIDHSREDDLYNNSSYDGDKFELNTIKQTLDTLIDSVCNREVDENFAEQSNTDLLPPELKEAIFEDLPHDLLDGISMQDIFPKMIYEDFLPMDLKNDNPFTTELLKDNGTTPDDDIGKPPDSKVFKVDDNDLWVHLESKSSVQNFMDDLLNSKNKKRNGKELKRSKSEVISNNSLLVGGSRHQRSCSLTWSCKLDNTYGSNNKRCKQPGLIDSQTERASMFHGLRIPETIMLAVGRTSSPNVELKYCLEDNKNEHKRPFWQSRQQPRILQVDGSVDPSSASECSSPEYNVEDKTNVSIPQLDGENNSEKKMFGFGLNIPQLDGADDLSSDDECPNHSCQSCNCSYKNLTDCDTITTSDSDPDTMNDKFIHNIGSTPSQFITRSPSEGHTLSSEFTDLQVTSPIEASVPSPHPGMQIEPIAQALITPQIHTHATVETVHQTLLTSNDMIVQTQYTRTTTTVPNAPVLPTDNSVQITEIQDPHSGNMNSNSVNNVNNRTITCPQTSPAYLSTGVQTMSNEGGSPSNVTYKTGKTKSKVCKSRSKGIRANPMRNAIQHHINEPMQNEPQMIQLQPQRSNGPTVILQQVPNSGMMSAAYVETLQQQSGQNVQYILGGQPEPSYEPQYITTNQLVPGSYIQAPSENLLTLQNGGISILPSVQIAQPQPTVLGTIIQHPSNTIQCGVISSEQLLLSSAPTLEMFTDSTGSMFVSNQPMYYGLETIVSNTVMSSSQFMTGAVPQVWASSYQTTTQVFQASKLMEPIVDVQPVPTMPNVAIVQAVQNLPGLQSTSGIPSGYVVVNQPPPMPDPIQKSQINIPTIPEQSFTPVACIPMSSMSCQPMMEQPLSSIQMTDIHPTEPQISSPVGSFQSIPRVAVKPNPIVSVPLSNSNASWKITEPLFNIEQPVNNMARPYFDSKHVSENTSMIKSSISSKIPPLPNHCITERNIVHVVNDHCNNYDLNMTSSNNINGNNNPVIIGSNCDMPMNRPMNRVLPMQAIAPKPDAVENIEKSEIMTKEPTKPVIELTEPETVLSEKDIVQNSEPVGIIEIEKSDEPSGAVEIDEVERVEESENVDQVLKEHESIDEKVIDIPLEDTSETRIIIDTVDEPIEEINTHNETMKSKLENIEQKETFELKLDQEKSPNSPLKIILQKQIQDGSYKITQNMQPIAPKKPSYITSVEVLSSKNTPQLTSVQLLPIKTFTLKTNKIDEKIKPIDNTTTRLITKSIKTINSSKVKNTRGPSMMYEIKSQDGFTHTASSMSEVWETVFEAVQSARKAHNLPPLPHNPLAENLGLENKATIYLVEQLPGVNRCTKYKPKFHDLKPPEQNEIENDLPSESLSGASRAEAFKGRKVHDMFSWLASRHRQQPKMIAISEVESRRVASTNLPMAMRFRILKETSKESVGVYHSHIHGRGLFCLRDIEAGEMVIEYAGEVIRASLTDKREKYYDTKNIGCYMFKIDDHFVVDATMKGNAARFINHSCEPNCYSRVVDILGKKHILIFALRRIIQGEELTYDYKFPFEDIKIPCTCGSRRCRKYLN